MNLVEAAALLVGVELRDAINDSEKHALGAIARRRGADVWEQEIVRAIQAHTLIPDSLAIRNLALRRPTEIDVRTVSRADLLEPWACHVSEDALLEWCTERGAPIPPSLIEKEQHAARTAVYPDILSAAIEAFEAVHDDQAALRGKTAKQALRAWLDMHKTNLSKNARTLAAAVANWQRKGGAPKTPGK